MDFTLVWTLLWLNMLSGPQHKTDWLHDKNSKCFENTFFLPRQVLINNHQKKLNYALFLDGKFVSRLWRDNAVEGSDWVAATAEILFPFRQLQNAQIMPFLCLMKRLFAQSESPWFTLTARLTNERLFNKLRPPNVTSPPPWKWEEITQRHTRPNPRHLPPLSRVAAQLR